VRAAARPSIARRCSGTVADGLSERIEHELPLGGSDGMDQLRGTIVEWLLEHVDGDGNVVIAVMPGLVALGGRGSVGLWQDHERPEFCATCVIMDPYLDSWQASGPGPCSCARGCGLPGL
jgi:hypothetical protein